jgi:phenylacetate-CoA ligase
VAAATFGSPDVERHVHRYRKQVPETVDRQRRLRRRWDSQRDALHRRTTWPPELILEWQLDRLAAIVDHAFATIPFYRDLYGRHGYRTGDIVTFDDFAALPAIGKADLVAGFPDRNVLPGVDPGACYGARTSGSTGVPVTLIQDDLSAERWMVNRMRQFEQMAGRRLEPADWIYNVYLSTWSFTSFDGDYPVFTVSEDCPPRAVAEHIALLRPKVVSAFPSFLRRLAEHCADLDSAGVLCVCTNSESSTARERRDYARHFGVPVLDEYATEELSIVATECLFGRYHVVEDRIRVDVADVGPDGIGDILATDMSNTYMPVIRYTQGDLVNWTGQFHPCECGSTFRTFDRFLGRADQALLSPVTGRVPTDQVMNLCDRTLVSHESGVAQFRVVQHRVDDVEVHLVLREGVTSADPVELAEFRTGLRALFDSAIGVRFTIAESLPRTASYKRRMVVCEVSGDGVERR